jgi:peptidoglycan hydrolase CwlO-like protein
MSLKSKAELQLTSNKLTDIRNEIDQLERSKQDKNIQIDKQETECDKLRTDINIKQNLIA